MFGSVGGATVTPWNCSNASTIVSVSLRKSSTNVRSFSGWIRFSRDSVCTAASPTSILSTYIVCSSGWSNPVWNFSATISSPYSGPANRSAVCDSGNPFMPCSVSGTPVPSSSLPENATSVLMSS